MVILTSVFLFCMQYENAFATVTINCADCTIEKSCIIILNSGNEMEYVIKICNEYICGMKIFCHDIHSIENLFLMHKYFSSIIWQTRRRHKYISCQTPLNMN